MTSGQGARLPASPTGQPSDGVRLTSARLAVRVRKTDSGEMGANAAGEAKASGLKTRATFGACPSPDLGCAAGAALGGRRARILSALLV
ncbi:MAG: hypothetical protein WA734_09305, partial [Candidatus Acidiferrales bacterium]